MSKSKAAWCAATLILGLHTAGFAEGDVTVGVGADLFSKYVWRGQNLVDDWVFQPSVSAGYKGLTGSIWGNLDLTGDFVDDGEFNEVDYAIDYSNDFPGQETLGYSVGVIYYDFPNTPWEATSEFYGGLSVDAPLRPAVKWFYDFDEADGSYLLFSIGHTVEKIASWREGRSCVLVLSASLGYGTDNYDEFYFGVDDAALNDVTLSAGVPFTFGSLTVKPSVAYSMMIDDDIRRATGESDSLWAGVGLSYSF
ncbi:MAG: hypothetical protein GXY19_02465 [Phycisphaerae bacterium]|nr:hypothetical protein [Phycisphaerae bacterium]